MSGVIPHPPYAFMPFTLTMFSLFGRSYKTDRQTDGNREREGMHVQLPVLCLMITFKLFLSYKSNVTAWTLIHYQFPLLTSSTPCHKEYSSEEVQQAAKKSPSKTKPLHSR